MIGFALGDCTFDRVFDHLRLARIALVGHNSFLWHAPHTPVGVSARQFPQYEVNNEQHFRMSARMHGRSTRRTRGIAIARPFRRSARLQRSGTASRGKEGWTRPTEDERKEYVCHRSFPFQTGGR